MEFPYTILYGRGDYSTHELWRVDGHKLIEKICSSRNETIVEDKFNRLHIEHFGSPANYSKGIFPNQSHHKMDVPGDMIYKIKIPQTTSIN